MKDIWCYHPVGSFLKSTFTPEPITSGGPLLSKVFRMIKKLFYYMYPYIHTVWRRKLVRAAVERCEGGTQGKGATASMIDSSCSLWWWTDWQISSGRNKLHTMMFTDKTVALQWGKQPGGYRPEKRETCFGKKNQFCKRWRTNGSFNHFGLII